MKLPSWLRSFWSLVVRGRLIVSLVAVLAALLGAVWWCGWEGLRMVWWWSWEWLGGVSECRETRSTTIRNIGLLVGGGIAIWVAYRRSVIAQHGLLNERYQKGTEMLGSDVLAVRLGGIYVLQRLAEDEPKQYHVQVMQLLCAFVRNPTKDEDDKTKPPGTEKEPNIKDYQVREDVQEAMGVIGNRRDSDIELEKRKKNFVLDLTGAVLPFAYLFKANLTDVVLTNAIFYPSNLTARDRNNSKFIFACADLCSANLSNAFLTGADLTRAHLAGANLTGTQLVGAKGLTQEQLNQACADPDDPPNLSNLRDAATDAPLEWRGPPCGK